MGYVKITALILIFLIVSAVSMTADDGNGNVNTIRKADQFRKEIEKQNSDFEAIMEVISTGLKIANKPNLSANETEEVRVIVEQLAAARLAAWVAFKKGDAAIVKEIMLFNEQSASMAEWQRKKARREKLRNGIFNLLKGISSVASAYNAANAQVRLQELGGNRPVAAQTTSGSIKPTRGPNDVQASVHDFVDRDAGYGLDDIFDPFAIDETIQHLSELNNITGQCWDDGTAQMAIMYPSWEGRLPYSDGLDGAKLGTVLSLFWDCSIQGKRKPSIVP